MKLNIMCALYFEIIRCSTVAKCKLLMVEATEVTQLEVRGRPPEARERLVDFQATPQRVLEYSRDTVSHLNSFSTTQRH